MLTYDGLMKSNLVQIGCPSRQSFLRKEAEQRMHFMSGFTIAIWAVIKSCKRILPTRQAKKLKSLNFSKFRDRKIGKPATYCSLLLFVEYCSGFSLDPFLARRFPE